MLPPPLTHQSVLLFLQHYGKIPLIDCTLVEDSHSDIFFFDDDSEYSIIFVYLSRPNTRIFGTRNRGQPCSTPYVGLDAVLCRSSISKVTEVFPARTWSEQKIETISSPGVVQNISGGLLHPTCMLMAVLRPYGDVLA